MASRSLAEALNMEGQNSEMLAGSVLLGAILMGIAILADGQLAPRFRVILAALGCCVLGAGLAAF